MDDLTRRALAAYLKTGGTEQAGNSSGPAAVDGKDYVVLRNTNGILAVYRVKVDGVLKRLKRYPSELESF